MAKLNIKLIFLFKFLLLLIICLKLYSNNLKASENIIALGKNSAPIKIKIFSSLTCPHCANFHNKIVPKIKEKYIEIGKVQLIFMDFPLDQAALNASIILHCLDQKKQIDFLDKLYAKQSKWTKGSDIDEINSNLKKMTQKLGITSNEFGKCLKNEAIIDKILNERINAQKKYSINSTPTIIINEKKFEGSTDFKNMKKKIDKLI